MEKTKTIKKALSLILCAVMAFGAAPFAQLDLFTPQASAADYDEPTVYTDGYYTFEVHDFNAYITGVDESISGDVVIPSTLRGLLVSYPVKWIYNYAFYDCTNITSITIPDSVTCIDNCAFEYCYSLESITIPDSVTSIGNYAFEGCTSLESVTFGENSQLTSIGWSAFYNCTSLTSITIPDSVTFIGSYAFFNCYSLESITFGESVTSIGDGAFEVCTSLTSITVNSNNKNYSSDEYGVLFNKDKTELIQYPAGNTRTSYTIPDSVTSIGGWAFYYCTSLESVTIPDSVTSIGKYAFSGCKSLEDVYYSGTESEWNAISIYDYNECLTEANIHFNSTGVLTGVVKYPSQITIDYGDSIILHVDESKIPDGGYVEWSSDNENFTVTASEDGKTITVTPNENGETNFTATIFDKDGNVVGSDTQTMTSKVNLFVKIIAFFKKLFGLNKVIPESLVELF